MPKPTLAQLLESGQVRPAAILTHLQADAIRAADNILTAARMPSYTELLSLVDKLAPEGEPSSWPQLVA